MKRQGGRRSVTGAMVLKFGAAFALLGLVSFGLEHWGDRYMDRFATFVAAQGSLGPVVFVAVNALLTMLLVPQVLFSVAAGVLFGWKFGTIYASAGMTIGAVGAFLLARYGVRDRLRAHFVDNPVYRRMQFLSRVHPLHLISLSRIIPVLPFPVTSYLLGITEVRSLPYALLSWACMLPETLFLTSGGHLLKSGLRGRVPVGAAVVLAVAGVAVAVIVHRMKRRLLDGGEDDGGEGDGPGDGGRPSRS